MRCDDEIARYYLRFLGQYQLGINGCHITVISKYDLADMSKFEKYVGRHYEFQYGGPIYTNGRAYWLDCYCAEWDSIRLKNGLSKREFHLTLGNIKYNRIKNANDTRKSQF